MTKISKIIDARVNIGDMNMFKEDKIWSCYSNDKVDIGERLARALRTLTKALPLNAPLRAISIGSSNEPQFRILKTSCRAGLYLLDIEKAALNVVDERIKRQALDHIKTIQGDYNKIFSTPDSTKDFLKTKLGSKKINLIILHHSLYYSSADAWHNIFANLYKYILAPTGAMHAVLMASQSANKQTTTWLYNHFAGKYFCHFNNQDLIKFGRALQEDNHFHDAQIHLKKDTVQFFVDDFEKFMSVVWMILLYPNVHPYSLKQRQEITRYMRKNFWSRKRPLLQMQDHLVVYRGIQFRGLI